MAFFWPSCGSRAPGQPHLCWQSFINRGLQKWKLFLPPGGALTGALLSEKQWGALLVGRSSLGRCLCSFLGPKVFLVPSPHASCAAGSCEMEVRREGGFNHSWEVPVNPSGKFSSWFLQLQVFKQPVKEVFQGNVTEGSAGMSSHCSLCGLCLSSASMQ